jgi:light-regulated signal transduction histidine kinase (bacteriophytochrome)
LLTEAAGLAGLSVQRRNATAIRCYFFRQEEVQQVAWGGNPNKPTEQQAGSLAITPRRSFERWVETRLGYCQEWPEDTRIKLLNLRGFLIGLVP